MNECVPSLCANYILQTYYNTARNFGGNSWTIFGEIEMMVVYNIYLYQEECCEFSRRNKNAGSDNIYNLSLKISLEVTIIEMY
jgi:hypothetical protein